MESFEGGLNSTLIINQFFLDEDFFFKINKKQQTTNKLKIWAESCAILINASYNTPVLNVCSNNNIGFVFVG